LPPASKSPGAGRRRRPGVASRVWRRRRRRSTAGPARTCKRRSTAPHRAPSSASRARARGRSESARILLCAPAA